MQTVSQPTQSVSRLLRALQAAALTAGLLVALGSHAAGILPALGHGSGNGAARASEPAALNARGGEGRPSLRQALVDGGQPSGAETRRQLSADERRALTQDLREAARDVNENRRAGY